MKTASPAFGVVQKRFGSAFDPTIMKMPEGYDEPAGQGKLWWAWVGTGVVCFLVGQGELWDTTNLSQIDVYIFVQGDGLFPKF